MHVWDYQCGQEFSVIWILHGPAPGIFTEADIAELCIFK